jgi:hypothetical protein
MNTMKLDLHYKLEVLYIILQYNRKTYIIKYDTSFLSNLYIHFRFLTCIIGFCIDTPYVS